MSFFLVRVRVRVRVRVSCWIATVVESSTTECGFIAKPWAALPRSMSVILESRVLRF